MSRPVLKIPLAAQDQWLNRIGVAIVLVLIVVPILIYGDLPEEIPTHFGANGKPDDFNQKSHIFVLPCVALLLFVGLYWLAYQPHLYNYTVKITEENAERQYKNASRMMRFLNLSVLLLFAYIEASTISTAMGYSAGLSAWFLPAILVLMVGLPIFFIAKSSQLE